MRSLEANFKSLYKKHPEWSSLVTFNTAVTNRKYSQKIILKWFNILVEKDDYSKEEKSQILDHAMKLTNPENMPEEGMKTRVIGH